MEDAPRLKRPPLDGSRFIGGHPPLRDPGSAIRSPILLHESEKEYQAGLANHQAGKIEEARQNFDNALDALAEQPSRHPL